MWAAGTVAAMSSITFPAVSALISRNAESDQQGEICTLVPSAGTSLSWSMKSCILHNNNSWQQWAPVIGAYLLILSNTEILFSSLLTLRL